MKLSSSLQIIYNVCQKYNYTDHHIFKLPYTKTITDAITYT